MLNHHNKLTIRMIEQQTRELLRTNTTNKNILIILDDFVPDVKYILAEGGVKELKLSLKENPHFSYFVSLVQGRKPRPIPL
ncbi:MAG: hypothetical protein P1U74_11390 [Legionellaceae bacterium]|nr:hypothetical protein [Legionellaceae bacterium]